MPLLKSVFDHLAPLGGQKIFYHIKFKNKISNLGEKISILPWQMAEQSAVEVDVKNVTHRTAAAAVHSTEDKLIYLVWIRLAN